MPRIRSAAFALRPLAGLALAAVVGCGGGRAELGGTVTCGGRAVRSGTVSAVGGDGIPRAGLIGADGRYRVADLPPGAVRLAVASPDPAKARPKSVKKGEQPPPTADSGWFPVPEKYADFATSGLATTAAAGPNGFDLDLK